LIQQIAAQNQCGMLLRESSPLASFSLEDAQRRYRWGRLGRLPAANIALEEVSNATTVHRLNRWEEAGSPPSAAATGAGCPGFRIAPIPISGGDCREIGLF